MRQLLRRRSARTYRNSRPSLLPRAVLVNDVAALIGPRSGQYVGEHRRQLLVPRYRSARALPPACVSGRLEMVCLEDCGHSWDGLRVMAPAWRTTGNARMYRHGGIKEAVSLGAAWVFSGMLTDHRLRDAATRHTPNSEVWPLGDSA